MVGCIFHTLNRSCLNGLIGIGKVFDRIFGRISLV
jgi:hypothetical protein